MTRKNKRSVRPRPIVQALHYAHVLTLAVSIVAVFSIGWMFAVIMGDSMGTLGSVGTAYASPVITLSVRQRSIPLPPLPSWGEDCHNEWIACSTTCNDENAQGLSTKLGWRTCQRLCDLKVLTCEKDGSWPAEVPLKEATYVPQ